MLLIWSDLCPHEELRSQVSVPQQTCLPGGGGGVRVRPHLPWNPVLDCRVPLSFSLGPTYLLQSDIYGENLGKILNKSYQPTWGVLGPNRPTLFQMKKAPEMPKSAAFKISSCTLQKPKVWEKSFGKKCKLHGQTVPSQEPQTLSHASLWLSQPR